MILSNDRFENPWGPEKPREDSQKTEKRNKGKVSNPIDDFIDHLHGHFKKGEGGGGGPQKPNAPFKASWKFFFLIPAAVIGMWLSSGFYLVEEGAIGVVLRFGEINRTSLPGLRYRLPSPMEKHVVKNVATVNKIDGGLIENASNETPKGQDFDLFLTGDENMVHIGYTVLWKIKDVSEFLFVTKSPEKTISAAAESALREILGQTTARLALTEGREKIGEEVQKLLQDILDFYKMGVHVVSVQLQRVEAPSAVTEAFHDMQASLVDADRIRNEAEAYEKDIIPRARGEAQKIIQAAEAYKQQVIAKAEGETKRFSTVLEAYAKNPALVRQKFYFETIEDVLKKAQKVTIIDHRVTSLLPHMTIDGGVKGELPPPPNPAPSSPAGR